MRRFHSGLTGVSALASVSVIALAEALGVAPATALAAGAVADQSNNLPALGEVVVTAQKRKERVMTVAAAVSVLPTQELQTAGVTEIRDLNGLVPGLLVQGSFGSGEFVTRGLDSTADSSPVTGIQIDGVPIGPVAYAAGGAYELPSLDPSSISRVEVLKGPQGTLFGGSTLGGIVQFVTKKPDLDRTEGSIYAEGSGTEHGDGNYSFRGAFSAPVVQDKLGFSISAYDNDLGGYLDDKTLGKKDFDDHRSYGARTALLWQVNPDFQVEVSDLYSKLNSRMDMLPYTRGGQPQGGDLVNNDGILPIYNTSFNIAALHATYDLHWATLTYVGSYQSGQAYTLADYAKTGLGGLVPSYLEADGGVAPAPDTTLGLDVNSNWSKYTSELRLASPDEGRVRWLVGMFYNHESAAQFQNIADFQTDQSVAPPPVNSILTFDLLTHLTEVAGFGDVTFYVTPQLDITGGVRVGNVTQNYEQLAGGADFAPLNVLYTQFGLSPTTPADTGVKSASQGITTYLANVRYHITPNDMVYFRYATGFRVGGPNFLAAGLPPTFQPDTTQDFEGGWKTNFWSNRGYLDLDAYYVNWDNMQVQTSVGGLNGITNGAQSVSRGVEASVNLTPIHGLNLAASGAYDDAHLTEVSQVGTGAPGDPLPNAPKWSGALTANYEWNVGDDWQPFVGGQVRYVDSRHFTFIHSTSFADYILPAYTVVDIQAGVQHGPWEMTVFARNLGDERAQLGDYAFGANYIMVQRPRTIGLSVGVRW